MSDKKGLTIALAKGRLFKQMSPLLKAAGIELLEDPAVSRKLEFPTTRPDVTVLVVRSSDVPTYVEYGAADLGVVGKDVLDEHGGRGLYEPLDLGVGACRLSVAGRPDSGWESARQLRVATKYTQQAREYFSNEHETPVQVELIKLYGSMELAPLVGLADVIVDLVDTGNTLRANGLDELKVIRHSTARLIVNKAAAKLKHRKISDFTADLARAVEAEKA